MAKASPKSPEPKPSEVESPVVLMRKVGPEHFEVLTATLRGALVDVKVLEKRVSLVVGRGTARRALAEQHRKNSESLGLKVDA